MNTVYQIVLTDKYLRVKDNYKEIDKDTIFQQN